MPRTREASAIIEEQRAEIDRLRRELARVQLSSTARSDPPASPPARPAARHARLSPPRGGPRAHYDPGGSPQRRRAAPRAAERQPPPSPPTGGPARYAQSRDARDSPPSQHHRAPAELTPRSHSTLGQQSSLPYRQWAESEAAATEDEEVSQRALEESVEALRDELRTKERTVADVEAAVAARAELRASLQREADGLRRDSEELRRELTALRAEGSLEAQLQDEERLLHAAEERRRAAEERRAACEAEFDAELQRLHDQVDKEQSDFDGQRVELAADYEARLRETRQEMVASLESAKSAIVNRFAEERAQLRGRVTYLEKAIERKQREIEDWHEKNVEAQSLLKRTREAHARAQNAGKQRQELQRGQAERGERLAAKYETELRMKQDECERLRGMLQQYLSGSPPPPSGCSSASRSRRQRSPRR
eukprot:TRINITY_DN18644_c0_g2_i1.p1 TRINITY_DN18644_c0_g2~~TRINITY_DN18644_c0_g2_i1.p1  ORF type:complete len:424 (+),score=160.08 TRINITY_DN18644_c0_g2_i1:73-1344(+)